MSYYQNDLIYILSAGNKFLTVDRSNFLLRELPIITGTENNPSLCFQADERTGLYNSAEGEVSFSSLGSNSFTITRYGFRSWDKFGQSILFTKSPLTANRTQTFQDADGIIAIEDATISRLNNEVTDDILQGMLVKVDDATGVLLALGDVPANYALGLANNDAAPTEALTVAYKGQFTLGDWTDATGSALLTVGQRYYADTTTPGLLATTGNQLIGIAITTATLLLRLG